MAMLKILLKFAFEKATAQFFTPYNDCRLYTYTYPYNFTQTLNQNSFNFTTDFSSSLNNVNWSSSSVQNAIELPRCQ